METLHLQSSHLPSESPVKDPHPRPQRDPMEREARFQSLPLHILQYHLNGALPLGSPCRAPLERERETSHFRSPPSSVSQSPSKTSPPQQGPYEESRPFPEP